MINWEHLKQLSQMKTYEDIIDFEQEIGKLLLEKDPNLIAGLMELFDDKCPHYDVMYGLVHAVETYPKNDYVTSLLKKLPYLVDKCPFWADCLFNRIFNDEQYLSLFRSEMDLVPKGDLLKLFDVMAQESPHHKDLIADLRKELEDNAPN